MTKFNTQKSKIYSVITITSLLTSSTTITLSPYQAKAAEKEKCYGIAVAGMNDCAAADGSHSCAGLAKVDASGNEWVLLPKDTCKRIIGASLTPQIDINN